MPEPQSPMFHPNDFVLKDDVPQFAVEAAPRGSSTETIAINDLFLLDTAHRDFVLGKSRKLRAPLALSLGRYSVLFISPFVLVGLFVLGLVINNWITTIRLNTDGVTVQGQIVSFRMDSDGDSTTYYATYRFTPRDRLGPYTKEQSVGSSFYGGLSEGKPVNVTYLQTDPTLSRLADDVGSDTTQNIVQLVFAIFWNLFVFVGIIVSMTTYRRSKRLEREGRLIKGTVVSCKGHTDSDDDYTIKLKYTFRSPTGRNLSKQERHRRNDLKGILPPVPGTPVAVLYADDACYQVM